MAASLTFWQPRPTAAGHAGSPTHHPCPQLPDIAPYLGAAVRHRMCTMPERSWPAIESRPHPGLAEWRNYGEALFVVRSGPVAGGGTDPGRLRHDAEHAVGRL